MKRTALVAGALLLGATTAAASSPTSSKVTVPAAGPKSLTTSWTGKVPLGLSTTFTDCSGNGTMVDSHTINVSVARGAYNVVKARLTFVVESSPLLTGDFIEL
jgi:hypothetical protein